MTSPFVSIVIPAYNEEKNIVRCLQSLNAQSYTGLREIIVVDNSSSDATGALAQKEGATVIFEAKQGVIYARETGTRAAKGEIIIQTDADTTFPKDWLEQIMKAFSDNPEAVAVIGSFVFENAPWWGKYFTGLLFGITDLANRMIGRMVYIPGCNTAFKKASWHGYNLNLDQGGDEVALLKQLRKEGKIIFLRHNTALTSARRLKKGLLYNIFVTLLFYYVFDLIMRRLIGKSMTSYPKIREKNL